MTYFCFVSTFHIIGQIHLTSMDDCIKDYLYNNADEILLKTDDLTEIVIFETAT